MSINCRIRLKVFIIMLEKLFKLLRKTQMKIKHLRITRYTFMSLLATAMVIYNIRILEFLIARAWYNWITSYSTHVVEVSVIQSNIAQDLADGQIFNLNAGAPKGYLGYAYFRPLCTIIMLVNVLVQKNIIFIITFIINFYSFEENCH